MISTMIAMTPLTAKLPLHPMTPESATNPPPPTMSAVRSTGRSRSESAPLGDPAARTPPPVKSI